ncbi:uncharacterized protein LOC135347013 [Halichondria panicea]|uniref:uncharacterized protein LOC135347013 n=1 Tax=Halichondria panicea TaxID=6063 RepID=UPI00312B2FB3
MRNENRRPIWEDSDNAHGGLWSFKVRKMHTTKVWQELLLAAVGEQFSECVGGGDCVCGVSVRIRGFDQEIVQIWNEDMPVLSKSYCSVGQEMVLNFINTEEISSGVELLEGCVGVSVWCTLTPASRAGGAGEGRMRYIRVPIKKHHWAKIILKSLSGRWFQTTPISCVEEHNM